MAGGNDDQLGIIFLVKVIVLVVSFVLAPSVTDSEVEVPARRRWGGGAPAQSSTSR